MQSKITVKRIIKLLKENGLFQSKSNLTGDEIITGTVHTDSRKVCPGDIFVAIKGFVTDGHYYIKNAKEAGASLVITEAMVTTNLSQIKVLDSRKATALIINELTGNPTSKLKLIGITGTNGKTTTSFIISNILKQIGLKYGVIGTLGYYIDDEFFPTKLTTPDILDLNKIFVKMLEEGVEVVVMEVSAHAISLRRINGLKFDLACFTNLSRDHLDFYDNMDEYFKTKRGFVKNVAKYGKALINNEDMWGNKLADDISKNKYTIGTENCDYKIENIKITMNGSEFTCSLGKERCVLKTNLTGKYNIRNCAMGIIAVYLLYPEVRCSDINLAEMDFVPGRLERIVNNSGVTVYNDYAHTPDAIEKVLDSIKEFTSGRIITICGAGGDRDKGKRPEMFRKALNGSDLVIITNDNPRFENPNDIINDIVVDAGTNDNYLIIRDRKIAIETAIKLAHSNDIVLIAGKGHEEYQEIEGVRHSFSDKEVALNYRERPSTTGKLSVYLDLVWIKKILGKKFTDDKEYLFKYISTDSRTVKPYSLFIALKGERFDGHTYLEEVLAEPTNWAIVSRRINHPRCICVEDTLYAYGELAKHYLRLFNLKTIGITGSAGKTTTKEYIYSIFNQRFKTHKTHSNENNLVGLPKTIFNLSNKDEFAIFELGSNHPGEIERLAEICNPEVGIITYIGPSHLEFFKDINGVFKEKSSLFKHTHGYKLFNNDLQLFSSTDYGKSIGFNRANDLVITFIESNDDTITFKLNDSEYRLNTPVPYLSLNAAFAIETASYFGLDSVTIQKGLNATAIIKNRMEIIAREDRIIISDCYNANPISMNAAIEFWQNLKPDFNHIAFIGDMLELGENADKYHKDLAKVLKGNANIVTVGFYTRLLNSISHYDSIEKMLKEYDFSSIPERSVILLKASNSIKLNKLLEYL